MEFQTELSAHQTSTNTSTQSLLTEKLALSRELASLKPELDHLRAQTSANEGLLAEKLSLQRELSSIKAELDEERRAARKAQSTEASLEKCIGEAEKLRREVVRAEKKAAKLEKENEVLRAQVGEREDREKVRELENAIAVEKRGREAAERRISKTHSDVEAERAVLDDKLSQFRTKLKSTKDRLKESEADLAEAREQLAAAQTATDKPGRGKDPRKRSATSQQPDPDAAIGTPGDAGPANKRARRAASVAPNMGEKSNFSLTPYLNRTASVSVAPEERPVASIEIGDQASPSLAMGAPVSAPKPLSDSSPGKANLKASKPGASEQGSKKKLARKGGSIVQPTTLEKVAEEDEDQNDENAAPGAAESHQQGKQAQGTAAIPQAQIPKPKPKLKPSKKSLSSFSSYRDGSAPPSQHAPSFMQSKKKRKLTGGPARPTIFDEDEEGGNEGEDGGAAPSRSRLGSVGAFGAASKQRPFGGLGGGWGGGFGGGLLSKKRGPLTVSRADGFAFSPLKKERKAMRAASEAASVVEEA